MARPTDLCATAAKQRALLEQAAKLQRTFARVRQLTDAAGELPAKAQLEKAAAVNEAATKITELVGAEQARQMAAHLRRYAAVTEARNAEPQTHVRTLPVPALRRGHVSGRRTRPGVRRTRRVTRAGPSRSDPDQSEPPSRYALAGGPV